MGAPHYTPSGTPTEGSGGSSADIRAELALIEAGIEAMNEFPVTLWFEDANAAADQIYVSVPWQCTVEKIYAAVSAANGTTDTILTAKIGGTAITAGALTIPDTAAIADIVSTTPTAANAVSAGGAVEIETDGGGSTVMPVGITLVLKRT